MLPGMDGYQVLEGVRARKQTPVLMLAARGSVDERVKGLRLGADDYLPKPFSLIELVARIQALVRRRPSDGADITQLHIQDLHLDLLARRVFRGGTRLELTAKEFSLLSLLARHQGEILSKMMIAEQVWDMNYGDNIPDKPVAMPAQDSWRVRLAMARKWRDVVNKHGGDVTVTHLPEVGIKGNTHFPFADLNNVQIADLVSRFLKEKNLQ